MNNPGVGGTSLQHSGKSVYNSVGPPWLWFSILDIANLQLCSTIVCGDTHFSWKEFLCKWTCTTQTCVIQGSRVSGLSHLESVPMPSSWSNPLPFWCSLNAWRCSSRPNGALAVDSTWKSLPPETHIAVSPGPHFWVFAQTHPP